MPPALMTPVELEALKVSTQALSIKQIADCGVIAILPDLYTWSLGHGIDEETIAGRFHYKDLYDCYTAYDATEYWLNSFTPPIDLKFAKHKGSFEYTPETLRFYFENVWLTGASYNDAVASNNAIDISAVDFAGMAAMLSMNEPWIIELAKRHNWRAK